MAVPVNQKRRRWNESDPQRADYDFFGHLHTFCYDPRFVCNGSLIGLSVYGDCCGAFEPPQQTLAVFAPRKGRVLLRSVICEEDDFLEKIKGRV